MKYFDICSGVSAVSQAWQPLGWEAVGFAEIEPFPAAVLAYHYPDVPNFGDFTKITKDDVGEFDLLVGGTPCQDFSVAGRREGWAGKRGSLTNEYVRLLRRTMPTWFVWENVPGVLSGKHAAGFISFIKKLKKLGYDVGWRTLDAQYVRVPGYPRAVPQRRRRVFVVGSTRKGCVAKVLFEPEGCDWDTPAGGAEGQGAAGDAARGAVDSVHGCWLESDVAGCVTNEGEKRRTLIVAQGQANAEINHDISPTLNCNHEQPIICVHGSQDPISNSEVANCVGRNQGQENCVAISGNIIGRAQGNGGNQIGFDESGVSYTLTTADRHAVCYENHAHDSRVRLVKVSPTIGRHAGTGGGNLPLVQSDTIVRRLTPVECERLMGFPDNYTRIPWRGKPEEECPDGHRYKACGNSMCVNVMRWLGMRIDEYK